MGFSVAGVMLHPAWKWLPCSPTVDSLHRGLGEAPLTREAAHLCAVVGENNLVGASSIAVGGVRASVRGCKNTKLHRWEARTEIHLLKAKRHYEALQLFLNVSPTVNK